MADMASTTGVLTPRMLIDGKVLFPNTNTLLGTS